MYLSSILLFPLTDLKGLQDFLLFLKSFSVFLFILGLSFSSLNSWCLIIFAISSLRLSYCLNIYFSVFTLFSSDLVSLQLEYICCFSIKIFYLVVNILLYLSGRTVKTWNIFWDRRFILFWSDHFQTK